MFNNLDIGYEIMLDSLSSWFRYVMTAQLSLLGSPICPLRFHKTSILLIDGRSFDLFWSNLRNRWFICIQEYSKIRAKSNNLSASTGIVFLRCSVVVSAHARSCSSRALLCGFEIDDWSVLEIDLALLCRLLHCHASRNRASESLIWQCFRIGTAMPVKCMAAHDSKL
ncbi:hypothetical protein HanIR_Chr11g0559641 [Helianthus annuus]|nr:hypothetical protein HanIR_Chr11g0559641 [Helianthus annuus]